MTCLYCVIVTNCFAYKILFVWLSLAGRMHEHPLNLLIYHWNCGGLHITMGWLIQWCLYSCIEAWFFFALDSFCCQVQIGYDVQADGSCGAYLIAIVC